MVGERTIDGFEALTLASEAAGGLEAALVPGAGMVVCSLRHRGEELLGQRGGLRTYVERHSTMGIPLLYPWANRVAGMRFEVAGREVDLRLAKPAPASDAAGLPIHGLLSAASGWRVERHAAHDNGGSLTASLDFGADSVRIEAFPFPHLLRYEADLRGPTLSIATTVDAGSGSPVPIAFGYHPYLRLPGLARPEWQVQIPVRERMVLDEHLLPTDEREPIEIADGALGRRTFDDEYVAPGSGRPFVLAGGGRRIEVELARGYPFSQVYAPADDDVIAFEPMTAPTNALVRGGPELPILRPGELFEAGFAITVADQT